MSTRTRFKTFVTEQRMLLITQIAILLGLVIQVIMFAFLLWYGRPADSSDTALVQQFFLVAALWVITIDLGVGLFWWVSKQGDWPIDLSEFIDEEEVSPEHT
ncbi:MAG: hypothetical protein JSW61_10130 [Candidatus Thorarchaeota archaeon]|nr:MAG: hypothetical protein JSW61_10130 [Candidatus Thorarchaeota archaeon]